eukprot:m.178519 g.178519  ORF g.178519 m.178519 type:complete len:447 (+) comp16838_c1_seq7:2571-3911(+)
MNRMYFEYTTLVFLFLIGSCSTASDTPGFAAWMVVVQPNDDPAPLLAQTIALRQHDYGIVWLVSSFAQQTALWEKHGQALDAYSVDVRVTQRSSSEIYTDGLTFEAYDTFVLIPSNYSIASLTPTSLLQPTGCHHPDLLVLNNLPSALTILQQSCFPLATGPCSLHLTVTRSLRAYRFPNSTACLIDKRPALSSLNSSPLWLHNKTVFFHVPKTGGTTVEALLGKCTAQTASAFIHHHRSRQSVKYACLAWDKTPRHHLPANLLDACGVESTFYDNALLFAILRAPLDRFLSSCQHFQSFRSGSAPENIVNSIAKNWALGPFGDMAQTELGITKRIPPRGLHFIPQTWLVYAPSGRRQIHFLAPMAAFANITRAFMAHVGCEQKSPLPHSNVGSKRALRGGHTFWEQVNALSKTNREALQRLYDSDARLHEYFERKYTAQKGSLFA